jgi:phosphate:Na+ symporter
MDHVERTGHHARDLVELAQIKVDRYLCFSDEALSGMKELEGLTLTMYDLLAELLTDPGKIDANFRRIETLENDMDIKTEELLKGHVLRLEQGKCTIEAGVYFMDIVNFLERISDHIFKAARDIRAGETGMAD